MRHHSYSFDQDPVGCGLAGCLGGLLAGFAGGIVLLLIAALTAASVSAVPEPAPDAATPDLRLTVDEAFLNRYAEQPAEGSVSIDILPGNQVQLIAHTTVQAFGLEAPVQINGLFAFQLTPQRLTIQLVDTQILGIDLPPEVTDFFSEDILLINQDLSILVDEISKALGTPVILTNLTTTNSQIQIELREAQ